MAEKRTFDQKHKPTAKDGRIQKPTAGYVRAKLLRTKDKEKKFKPARKTPYFLRHRIFKKLLTFHLKWWKPQIMEWPLQSAERINCLPRIQEPVKYVSKMKIQEWLLHFLDEEHWGPERLGNLPKPHSQKGPAGTGTSGLPDLNALGFCDFYFTLTLPDA